MTTRRIVLNALYHAPATPEHLRQLTHARSVDNAVSQLVKEGAVERVLVLTPSGRELHDKLNAQIKRGQEPIGPRKRLSLKDQEIERRQEAMARNQVLNIQVRVRQELERIEKEM